MDDATGKAFDPGLLSMVGRVIGAWPHAETQMSCLAAALLKTDFTAVAAMIGVLRSARRDAVEAAGEAVLEGERLDLFKALMKRLRAAERRRNRYAHWVWLSVNDRPDLLALAPQRTMVDEVVSGLEAARFIARYRRMHDAGIVDGRIAGVFLELHDERHPRKFDRRDVLVYSLADVEADLDEVVMAAFLLHGMVLILHPLSRPDAESSQLMLSVLREALLTE